MNIDCVFSGGGVKAFAYVGVLESMRDNNLHIVRTAGTSAGAIVASFVAAGYDVDEIRYLIDELNLKNFADPPRLSKVIPFSKWLFLYWKLGINKGDRLESWMQGHLSRKDVRTFGDIEPGHLKVVISDLSLGKLVVIPDDLERVYGLDPKFFPVAKAVRMSAGFPFFFMPKQMPGRYVRKSIIVDGGLLSNFPLWIFDNGSPKPLRPILGVKLTSIDKEIGPRNIRNAIDMFQALFSTMKQAHDARYISKTQEKNIIFVPVKNIEAVDFDISPALKEELIESGREQAAEFLKSWST